MGKLERCVAVDTSQDFLPEALGARQARRFVRGELAAMGPVAELAELLVSELVTNVVRHARTPFTVAVTDGDPIRVSVRDGVAADLRVTAARGDATSGRGLAILEALAHRWGVEPREGGKEVWFELLATQRL